MPGASDGRLPLSKLSGAGAAPGQFAYWTGTRWIAVDVVFDSIAADGPPEHSPFWYVTDESC